MPCKMSREKEGAYERNLAGVHTWQTDPRTDCTAVRTQYEVGAATTEGHRNSEEGVGARRGGHRHGHDVLQASVRRHGLAVSASETEPPLEVPPLRNNCSLQGWH